ncbi:hypothetical protein BDV33DRAFT_210745 [Aspergillus novoparasiticus]|uniref:HMG box domain-containing protein n=1 Tax=Aspergillus novoparasiticus TaxID=986946 RepID=A0A5N6E692_9EURO|nr:hypothetical protein BDV33DRAFT_210745 [Aspergillus novoparasiticus]
MSDLTTSTSSINKSIISIRLPEKYQNATTQTLAYPLSQLPEHMADISARKVECWVRRVSEDRHQEASQRGRVPRPVNVFLLYRKAYLELSRELLGQADCNRLSVLIGQSWNMETPEVRLLYERLAKVERACHRQAFPNYRFSPKVYRKRPTNTRRRTIDRGQSSADACRTLHLSERNSGCEEWGLVSAPFAIQSVTADGLWPRPEQEAMYPDPPQNTQESCSQTLVLEESSSAAGINECVHSYFDVSLEMCLYAQASRWPPNSIY